jgi:hypothetical protein
MPKILSSFNINYVSYLMEKNNLLPPTQFRGRPGHNTTDALLLVTSQIKNTWRKSKVTGVLFLDIQGAFLNMVKDQLIHDMKL